MAAFKEFTGVIGDPVIVNRDSIIAASIEVVRRGEKHEAVNTVLHLSSGGRVTVKEPFSDIRDWLYLQNL